MISQAILSFFVISCVFAKAPTCCSSIRSQRCRLYCDQLLDVSTSTQQLLTAAEHCPRNMDSFWSCLNSSLPVARDTQGWPGAPCCDSAIGDQCRLRCHTARSKTEVRRFCSVNSEKALYSCIKRQEEGEQCCRQSESLSCGMVCRTTFLSSNSRQTLGLLKQHCGDLGSPVFSCMQRLVQTQRTSNPSDNLPCCDRAKTRACRDSCRTALQSTMSEHDIIDEMMVPCGSPDIREPLWQCFLQTQTSPSNHTPPASRLDNARLQCCTHAVTARCRDLCTQTYKSGWSYHSEFYKSCSYIQPVSTIEATMHKCLMDVDEPCQLGCSGLSFCTNFNQRPTELFRTCTRDADRAAEKALQLWENGLIRLPQMEIPVKDVRTCQPEKWKAIACALQIKPCLKQPSLLSLCKEDCIDILNQCVDHSRLGNEQSVPQLCNALPSARTPGACVPLSHHLKPSPYNHLEEEVTHPCYPNPCRGDEVCEIRRRKCKHPENCKQFICKAACSLGQVSSMKVPKGTYVRIPNTLPGAQGQDCFLGCRCDSKGELEHCRPLPCLARKQCMLGSGNKQEHNSHFRLDKSQCICHDGELICSRQTCPAANSPAHLTGSSSECSPQYKPVCGSNGKTYPNNCFARCAGVTIVSATPCSQFDPCQNSPCKAGERCVTRRQVCLGQSGQHTCPQYECVSQAGVCNSHHHDPVCDTTGEEFTNACLLLSHHRNIAYRGHCQQWCHRKGPVCGHDGETYDNQCVARAAGVTVDYHGACQALGNLTQSSSQTSSCARVRCHALRPAHCAGIIPPGACCPVCAAELRALFKPGLVEIASQRMEQGPISVQRVVRALSRLLMVAQCDLFGFLGLHGDLILLLAPLAAQPSDVQVEACNSEAERLETLIANGSPTLTLYLELSPILLAPAQTTSYEVTYDKFNNPRSLSPALQPAVLTLCIALLLTLYLQQRRNNR